MVALARLMALRHAADIRSLLWIVLTMAIVAIQFANPDWVKFLWPLSCYFALCCGVIAHNHNHCPTFYNRTANRWLGNLISIFYGYPTFAWIPTHNLNHHKYVNRPGDATITWRYSNKHGFWVAISYFFVSSYWQSGPIKEFIANAKAKNPKLFRQIVRQYFIWGGSHVGLLIFGITTHGWQTGLYIWALSCGVPGFFALWTIMLFNYEQHVHADPWSEHNHSRSWEGRVLNYLLFNNGLHAAHHESPATHWSKLWSVHRELAPRIDPRLVEKGGFLGYFCRQYFLAPIFPSLATIQIGRAPEDFSPTPSQNI